MQRRVWTKQACFLEACRFLEDNFASSSVLLVLKHSATALCTHCTFGHRNRNGEAKYSYSTDIQSGNSTYMRTIECTLALRHLMLTDQELRYLGMKAGPVKEIDEQGVSPLPILSLDMKPIESFVHKTICVMPVVRSDFTP